MPKELKNTNLLHLIEMEEQYEQVSQNDGVSYENGYSQWAVHEGGRYSPTMPTQQVLPPGFYELGVKEGVVYFESKTVNTDELYELPSTELVDMLDDIEKFWNRTEQYKKYKFLHKRGILLYGQPGCGKSGIIQLCTKHLVNRMQGIVINITNGDHVDYYSRVISSFRKIEPSRPIAVILEDLDSIASEGSWATSMILNMLDGIKQIDNVVYIATTNYPEKLEERITNRPSRFDRRYEIEMPNDSVRRSYFEHKLSTEDLQKHDIEEWVKNTEGMSLAHLRELVISIVAMDNSFEETVDRLNGLKIKPKIKGSSKTVGFGKSN